MHFGMLSQEITTDKRRTGNTCSTTELLRRDVPKAGLEPATTRLGGDNPILRPVENKANKLSGTSFADFLTGRIHQCGCRSRNTAIISGDFGCSPVSVARPLLP